MRIENYFIGDQEYAIWFKNGQHEVREFTNEEGHYNVIFTGNYKSCIEFRNRMYDGYWEMINT
jgi:hypothetical protein